MPREVLGRAVDDYVRAELQGPLEIRSAERIVHDQGCPRDAGYLRDLRYVGDAQERVGDGLDDNSAGLQFSDLLLHRSQIIRVDEAGLDAARAEDLDEQSRRRSVELVGRKDRAPARQLRSRERGMGGSHPRGEGESPYTPFCLRCLQRYERLLEGAYCGVVVAGVAVALFLSAEHAVRGLYVRVREGGRSVDRRRDRVEDPIPAFLRAGPVLSGVHGAGLETSRVLHGGLYYDLVALVATTAPKSRPRSEKIVSAAFLPGAIETPGPGWLPEPHR